MSGKYLLDTNIVIALFAKENFILKKISHAEEIFIPSIVIGELYFGAYKSFHKEANLKLIEEFSNNNTILFTDENIAKKYGKIKHKLQIKGKPIPENDIWISAIAKHHNLKLISRDHHFEEIEGISVEVW